MSAKKKAAALTADELAQLLHAICLSVDGFDINLLTSQQWTWLKFLALGLSASLRGSTEHYELKLDTLLPIHFDTSLSSKYIVLDPASFGQKTFRGYIHQGDAVSHGWKIPWVGSCLT